VPPRASGGTAVTQGGRAPPGELHLPVAVGFVPGMTATAGAQADSLGGQVGQQARSTEQQAQHPQQR
jgi:hypothetical protein